MGSAADSTASSSAARQGAPAAPWTCPAHRRGRQGVLRVYVAPCQRRAPAAHRQRTALRDL